MGYLLDLTLTINFDFLSYIAKLERILVKFLNSILSKMIRDSSITEIIKIQLLDDQINVSLNSTCSDVERNFTISVQWN